jgi:hypothetical protein
MISPVNKKVFLGGTCPRPYELISNNEFFLNSPWQEFLFILPHQQQWSV